MTCNIFDKYRDVIQPMTEAKYNTSLLCKALHEKYGYNIQCCAVDEAFRQVQKHIVYLSSMSKEHYLRLLSFQSKYTIVGYPVGYHFDTFKNNKFSLENKICLSFPSLKEDIGRGGDGSGAFVFALIDWANSEAGQRRRNYIAAGGELQHGQRLTNSMYSDLLE